MTANGISTLRALKAATSVAADLLQQPDIGILAAGKSADVVLLRANPLDDIAATRRIDAVVLRGHAFDRGQLDMMFADVQARVAAENAALDATKDAPKP